MDQSSSGPKSLEELLSDPLICAVGLVTVNFAALEQGLAYVLWAASEERKGNHGDTTREVRLLSQRLKELSRIAGDRRLNDGIRTEIESLVRTVGDLSAERNRIIHDVWLAETDEEGAYQRVTTTWQGAHMESVQSVEFGDVVYLATRIWAAREVALSLVSDLLAQE